MRAGTESHMKHLAKEVDHPLAKLVHSALHHKELEPAAALTEVLTKAGYKIEYRDYVEKLGEKIPLKNVLWCDVLSDGTVIKEGKPTVAGELVMRACATTKHEALKQAAYAAIREEHIHIEKEKAIAESKRKDQEIDELKKRVEALEAKK